MPTYHPAATLYDRSLKDAFMVDVASFASAVAKVQHSSIVLPTGLTPEGKIRIPIVPKGG